MKVCFFPLSVKLFYKILLYILVARLQFVLGQNYGGDATEQESYNSHADSFLLCVTFVLGDKHR